MRMWNVNPELMCNKHLLGEHLELHMFVGSIKKGRSIQGYLDNGLIEPQNIEERHKVLVIEMLMRGMKHNSPLVYKNKLGIVGEIDPKYSMKDLFSRCPNCWAKAKELMKYD